MATSCQPRANYRSRNRTGAPVLYWDVTLVGRNDLPHTSSRTH